MTVIEAKRIVREFYDKSNPTEDDRFLFTEAMRFLIEETKDSNAMLNLGAYYYEEKEFDLALKYYDMAAEYDNMIAISNLGYIWYYGRTGEKNYEKAFYYFDRAAKAGDTIAAYKVADMYKNGYYVEKDYEKYKEIIEDLYKKITEDYDPDAPLPEIYTRLAKIRSEAGDTKEALRLYDEARSSLEYRIQWHPFFGDRNIMKWMIADIYKLRKFDPKDFSLYDLYYLLSTPAKARFLFEETPYEVEAVNEEGGIAIRFGETWYRDIDDFFAKAELEGELLTTRFEELYGWEVL